MKRRQWQGGSHVVVGQGKQLWYGSVTGSGFGTVLCDSTPAAVEHFTRQRWAEGADRIDLETEGQRFHLYRVGAGWDLPADGRKPEQI